MLVEKKEILNNDIEISYLDNELKDKKVLIFVHGWGADKDNLKSIYINLIEDFRVISIDLPGFGNSILKQFNIGSIEYAEIINNFLQKLNINNVNYIGHSFGGKIGIILASKYNLINRLVLIDSAGIKSKRSIKWYFNVFLYKAIKYIYKKIIKDNDSVEKLKNKFGSKDYRDAGKLRNILIKVVNEDFTYLLDKIKCPVFLYWGQNDRDTPIWMAKKMNKLIKDSALYIVKGGGHYSFLDDNRIISIIRSFAI